MKKCAHNKFYGEIPDYAKHLRNFVEMGVVRIIVNIKFKLDDQIITYFFLGYAQNHMGGTYHMLNLRTKLIVLSRESISINKTYREYVSRKENNKANTCILQN